MELPETTETTTLPPAIAFVGYSRAGKDEAAKYLIDKFGFKRINFADGIKEDLDQIVRSHLGFSAFTEVDEQKAVIRPLLELWGDICYKRFLAILKNKVNEALALGTPVVNTKLVRLQEAEFWHSLNGTMVEVARPDYGPATDWEKENFDNLIEAYEPDISIDNMAGITQLHSSVEAVMKLFHGEFYNEYLAGKEEG